MNAYELAQEWQNKYGEDTLEERIEWHKKFGLVYVTPKLFILASELTYDPITKDLYMHNTFTNAWFIELAINASDESLFEHVKRVLPNKAEWVVWYRNSVEKVHAYKWDEFARKAGV
jgi:hypothetical protein